MLTHTGQQGVLPASPRLVEDGDGGAKGRQVRGLVARIHGPALYSE